MGALVTRGTDSFAAGAAINGYDEADPVLRQRGLQWVRLPSHLQVIDRRPDCPDRQHGTIQPLFVRVWNLCGRACCAKVES